MLQNLGETLTWYIRDPKFGSILLKFSLLLLSCIFILPLIYVVPLLTGYQLRVAKHIQGNLFELPEIDNDMWTEGLLFMVVVGGVSAVISLIFMGIPTLITGALSSGNSHDFLYYSASSISTLIANVVGLLLSFWSFLAMSIYARTKNIGDIFSTLEYRNMWEINGWNTVIGFILTGIVTSVVVGVGTMLFCIGVLPAIVIATIIEGSLVGSLEY